MLDCVRGTLWESAKISALSPALIAGGAFFDTMGGGFIALSVPELLSSCFSSRFALAIGLESLITGTVLTAVGIAAVTPLSLVLGYLSHENQSKIHKQEREDEIREEERAFKKKTWSEIVERFGENEIPAIFLIYRNSVDL